MAASPHACIGDMLPPSKDAVFLISLAVVCVMFKRNLFPGRLTHVYRRSSSNDLQRPAFGTPRTIAVQPLISATWVRYTPHDTLLSHHPRSPRRTGRPRLRLPPRYASLSRLNSTRSHIRQKLCLPRSHCSSLSKGTRRRRTSARS